MIGANQLWEAIKCAKGPAKIRPRYGSEMFKLPLRVASIFILQAHRETRRPKNDLQAASPGSRSTLSASLGADVRQVRRSCLQPCRERKPVRARHLSEIGHPPGECPDHLHEHGMDVPNNPKENYRCVPNRHPNCEPLHTRGLTL